MNEIAVFVRAGSIIVSFADGAIGADLHNLASRIKRLPDVNGAAVKLDCIVVTLSSARRVAALQGEIYQLAQNAYVPAPTTVQTEQLSLF
jgi:hypothetical protein